MLSFLVFSFLAAAQPNPAHFEQALSRQRDSGFQTVDRSGYEVVLVSGLFNENKPTYFNEMRASLSEDFRIPPSQIHMIHSRSNLGPDANVERVKYELERSWPAVIERFYWSDTAAAAFCC